MARFAGLIGAGAIALAGLLPAQPAAASPVKVGLAAPVQTPEFCGSAKHPALARKISRDITAALHGRQSIAGVTVADPAKDLTCAFHQDWHFVAASVIKATILATLLRKRQQKHKTLTTAEHQLAYRMITESDNNAASALWAQDGRYWLRHFLQLAGMTHTDLGPGRAWGLSELTARDELLLLGTLTAQNSVLDTQSRRYELWLMSQVIPSQRWGVTAGAPKKLTAHVKNGWLPYPVSDDWRINSIGAFTGDGQDYRIAMLTSRNPTMNYGIDTIQAVAEVINRHLNPGVTSMVPASRPYPSWGTPDEPPALLSPRP
jgi:hypothetical protein